MSGTEHRCLDRKFCFLHSVDKTSKGNYLSSSDEVLVSSPSDRRNTSTSVIWRKQHQIVPYAATSRLRHLLKLVWVHRLWCLCHGSRFESLLIEYTFNCDQSVCHLPICAHTAAVTGTCCPACGMPHATRHCHSCRCYEACRVWQRESQHGATLCGWPCGWHQ